MSEHVHNIPFDRIETGQSIRLTRRLTLHDLRFCTGNDPGQLSPDQVSSDLFHRLITHGMWGSALITLAVATHLPGPGSRLLHQELDYIGTISTGDTVTVELKVEEKLPDQQLRISCVCLGADGAVVIHGMLLVEATNESLTESRESVEVLESGGRRRQLRRLLDLTRGLPPLRTAVIHPVDAHALSGAMEARRRGLIIPVLVGPESRIRRVAEKEGLDISGVELIATRHSHAAAEKGVELARDEHVQCLMKGKLHTDEFMGAIVRSDSGLRTERRMSHAWVMDVPTYPRPLIITDSAINIRPDLMTKADIVRNAIDLARAMGVKRPKVAILSATEEVNPKMQSTLDAAALCKMAERGQIKGGELDGPLAFDNAISEVAARTKGIKSFVAGSPDILLAPDLESANMLGKQLNYLADAEAAGLVLGARVPLVLTSRADDLFSRVASCAIAMLVANNGHDRR